MQYLTEIRDRLEDKLQLEPERIGAIGVKTWLLPERYYRSYVLDDARTKAWLEFLAISIRWPRLVEVGFLQGAEQGESGIWPIGKGTLSYCLFSGRQFASLIHNEDWDAGIENLPLREFRRLPRYMLLGKTRKDFHRLRTKYGSAVFYPLRNPGSRLPPFGCITVHTPSDWSFSTDEIQEVVRSLADASATLSRVVLLATEYDIPSIAPTGRVELTEAAAPL